MLFERKHAKLSKLYKKELRQLFNSSLNYPGSLIDFFITYLQYLRDVLTVSQVKNTLFAEINLASINAALNEINNYNLCILKYYNIENNTIIRKNKDITDEETLVNYNLERNEHLAKFWEIVQINMKGWLGIDDCQI